MSDHLTEEEQLEALKRWWKENGKFIVVAVLVAVGGYFGWGAWQDQQRAQAEAASAQYEQLLSSLRAPEQELPAELVESLKQGSDLYALNAALIKARAAVEQDDLDLAVEQLQWVLNQSPDAPVAQLTRLRLARVLAAQGSHDAALAELQSIEPSTSFASEYAEVRGDILLAQGKTDDARGAYQAALESLTSPQQNRAALLQMKIDNLKTASASESAAGIEENAS